MSEEDDQAKSIARGITLEKRAHATQSGRATIVWLVVLIVVIVLGQAYTSWGGWVALWAVGLATIAALWASSGIKDKMLR